METSNGGRVAELTRKGRATRDRIVAAAAELIHDRGVSATNLQDVQAAAHVSGSQMYYHFPDKASLVREVISIRVAKTFDMFSSDQWRLDSVERLRTWRDMLVAEQRRTQCERACPLGSLASELANTQPDARVDLAAGFIGWMEAIRSGLRVMHRTGELNPDADPEQLAFALLAAVQGGLLISKTVRDVAPLAAAVDTVIDQIADLTRS
jgi:TetR/AcrR family transcriptional repressor of nem operon